MNKYFYKGNRQRLIDSIEDERALIILSSGYSKHKSADESYDFQVNTNFYYLTGIKQENVHLVILKDGEIYQEILYIAPYNELYEKWIGHQLTVKEASEISGIYQSNVDFLDTFEEEINDLVKEYKNVYLDLEKPRNTNFNSFGLALKTKLEKKKDVQIKDVYKNIITLRASKQRCEIAKLKSAIDTTQKGIEALLKNAKAGIYEYQLEAYFDFAIKQDGNKLHSFPTIAASGVNAATLHYSTNNSIIPEGSLILFDLGAKDDEYCADISRTFPVNGKFNPLQKKIYNIVLKTNKLIAKVARAGMTIKELQNICINSLAEGCLKAKLIKEKEEIKKYYFHGVSHTIGLDTHDPFTYDMPLPENAVISDEPGLYFKELGIGVRIEDDLLLKKDKAIVLSKNIIKEVKDIENFMKK